MWQQCCYQTLTSNLEFFKGRSTFAGSRMTKPRCGGLKGRFTPLRTYSIQAYVRHWLTTSYPQPQQYTIQTNSTYHRQSSLRIIVLLTPGSFPRIVRAYCCGTETEGKRAYNRTRTFAKDFKKDWATSQDTFIASVNHGSWG